MLFDGLNTARKTAKRGLLPPVPVTDWVRMTSPPRLDAAVRLAFDVETYDPSLTTMGAGWGRNDGRVVGVAIGAQDAAGNLGSWYFPTSHAVFADDNLPEKPVFEWLKSILETPVEKVGANLTYDIGWLGEYSIKPAGPLHDVQFAEALLDNDALVALEVLSHKYLGFGKDTRLLYDWLKTTYPHQTDSKLRGDIYRAPASLVGKYAQSDVVNPLLILQKQIPLLEAENLTTVYRLECELIPMMVAMRKRGVCVDVDRALKMVAELNAESQQEAKALGDEYGISIAGVASSQISKLFDAANVRYPKTDLGNASITGPWLKSLEHPLGEQIISIREKEKIASTFLRGYIIEKNVNQRLHPNFHQLHADENGTKVGRFACVEGSTEIQTISGKVKIKDIKINDKVLTHKNRYMPVTATWLKGKEQMFNVLLTNNETLVCTGMHRVLNTNQEWVTIESIKNEFFSNVLLQPTKCNNCFKSLPRSRIINSRASCKKIKHDGSQRVPYIAPKLRSAGTQSASCFALFQFKTKYKKPDARKIFRAASQLHWSSIRLQRIFDANTQWQASICASGCNGDGAKFNRIARNFSRASHRREPVKQLFRQFSTCNSPRSQIYSLFANTGQQKIGIKQINIGASHEVYDITVAQDESYFSCGIYSHNSSQPNLQNLPSRTKLGKRVRECFLPDEGHHSWIKLDFSQIHYRILAHNAVGQGANELRQKYIDNPKTDYHMEVYTKAAPMLGWSLTDQAEIKEKRRPIKNVNFGLLYGQSEKSLGFKNGFTKEQAIEFMKIYHKAAPYVKPTMKAIANEVQEFGYVITLLGRRIRFPLFEPEARDFENYSQPLPYEAALREYGAPLKRAYDYRGVNYKFQGSEPDIMKASMLALWRSGVFDVTGVPMITVHDECDYSKRDNSDLTNQAFAFVKHTMETTIKMRVPIYADMSEGPNWGKAD